MSVGVGADSASWLQQDGGESPADTMPDVVNGFSVVKWMNNLLPAVGEGGYKADLVLFTTSDLANPSYTDPYAGVFLRAIGGSQCVGLRVSGVSTPFVITGVEKRAYMVTYDAANHRWTFSVRRTAAWEIVGTVESNFLSTPITQMRMLNDGVAVGLVF